MKSKPYECPFAGNQDFSSLMKVLEISRQQLIEAEIQASFDKTIFANKTGIISAVPVQNNYATITSMDVYSAYRAMMSISPKLNINYVGPW